MNYDVFDLTQDSAFHKDEKSKVDSRYVHKLLCGNYSYSACEFIGDIQEYSEERNAKFCENCNSNYKTLTCNCKPKCSKCGRKLQYNEIYLCQDCAKKMDKKTELDRFRVRLKLEE